MLKTLLLLPIAATLAGCVFVVPNKPAADAVESKGLPVIAVIRKAGATKNEDAYFQTLDQCYAALGRMGSRIQVIEGCQAK